MGRSGALKPSRILTPSSQGSQRFCMSRLLNSTCFLISTCFILNYFNGSVFRLIAIKDVLLLDRNYPTLRGAKIAFKRLCQNFAWGEDVAAKWSHFYPPDQDWIQKMLTIAEKG